MQRNAWRRDTTSSKSLKIIRAPREKNEKWSEFGIVHREIVHIVSLLACHQVIIRPFGACVRPTNTRNTFPLLRHKQSMSSRTVMQSFIFPFSISEWASNRCCHSLCFALHRHQSNSLRRFCTISISILQLLPNVPRRAENRIPFWPPGNRALMERRQMARARFLLTKWNWMIRTTILAN